MHNLAAVILAGGRGKRMDILCDGRPKPSLPFAGRFRVIDFSLSNCINSQINNIVVLTDYQRSAMADYVNRWHMMNSKDTNLCILEPKGTSYNGTANALYQNISYFDDNNIDTVLILAGDHVYNFDYRKMLTFHQNANADVTVGVVPVPSDQAYRFGMVNLDADNRITDFVEKAPVTQSNLASMGIYVFNKRILAERLNDDASNPLSRHDFGYSILPGMVKQDRVFGYRFDGYWQDIGTVEAYYEANMGLTKEHPEFSLNNTTSVLTQDRSLPSPRIGKEAIIKNSLISYGCVVKGRVENSILSPGVTVEEQAVVRNSIIMDGAHIGHRSIVNRCVLDEDVKVGDFCYLGFGSSSLPNDQEITVLGKGVAVPPHATIGRGYKVSPDGLTPDFFTVQLPNEAGSRHSILDITVNKPAISTL